MAPILCLNNVLGDFKEESNAKRMRFQASCEPLAIGVHTNCRSTCDYTTPLPNDSLVPQATYSFSELHKKSCSYIAKTHFDIDLVRLIILCLGGTCLNEVTDSDYHRYCCLASS